MLRIALTLNFLQQWSGINAILSYSTIIFENFAPNLRFARFFTFLAGLVNMVATLSVFPLVDKYGRRSLLLIGELFLAITLLLTGLCTTIFPEEVSNYLTLVLILVFLVFFEMSIGPLVWVYCGESLYNKAMSLAIGMNWINVFLVIVLF
jgi:MFS family permease